MFPRPPLAFLLFLSFVDSSSAQCASCNEMPVRVAAFVSRSRLLAASALPVVPRLFGCSPFFGAACACAHEKRARVGDIGVNLSARSHREIREPTKNVQLVARFVGSAGSSGLAFSAGERVCGSRAYIHARPSLFVFCLHSFTVWHIGLVVNCLRVKGRVKLWFTFSVPSFTHRSEETSGQSGVNWAFFTPSSPLFAAHRLGVCACLQKGAVGAQRVKPFWRKPSPTTRCM